MWSEILETVVTQHPGGLGVSWRGVTTPSILPPRRGGDPGGDRVNELLGLPIDLLTVDSTGPDETLILTFSDFGPVTGLQFSLARITLTLPGTRVRLLHSGVQVGARNLPPTLGPRRVNFDRFDIRLAPGHMLAIQINGRTPPDSFALHSVVLNGNVDPVPEPSTFALVAVILAGGATLRRRRREA